MGRVYRAFDARLNRAVAIKGVLPERVLLERPEGWTARIVREGRAAAALTHPNAVAIYDVGEVSGAPYLVMELAVLQGSRRGMPMAV
jgi:serine/threonine protein kinase